ncbi:MAG: hypothetical protein LQ340_004581, partial [Diploschistes diacapsis]
MARTGNFSVVLTRLVKKRRPSKWSVQTLLRTAIAAKSIFLKVLLARLLRCLKGGDVPLASADRFGAAFSVPGIVTIGPNYKLIGNLQGQVSLGAYFETNHNLAKWDLRQTYPDANHDGNPDATAAPDRDGTQELLSPEWEYGISANGFITAHVKPTVTFGIDFNQNFMPIDICT